MTDFIIRLVRLAHLYLVRKTSFVFIDMKNHVGDIGKSYRRNTRNKYKKYVKQVQEICETCTRNTGNLYDSCCNYVFE